MGNLECGRKLPHFNLTLTLERSMPLRNHFHSSPTYMKWEALPGGRPRMIAQRLDSLLTEEYFALPSVRLGDMLEIDIAANKDRPEYRKSFVNKCELIVKKDVCITIVDPVTSRKANRYGELADELGAERTSVSRGHPRCDVPGPKVGAALEA